MLKKSNGSATWGKQAASHKSLGRLRLVGQAALNRRLACDLRRLSSARLVERD